VVGLIEAALQPLCPSTRRLDVQAAGRTDAGVSAAGQVISFHTYDSPMADAMLEAINAVAPGELRVWRVEAVPRAFHATFSAAWRRYLYLFPLRGDAPPDTLHDCVRHAKSGALGEVDTTHMDAIDVEPEEVDRLLRPLCGRTLNYSAFARDTVAGRDARSRLHLARASVTRLPPSSVSQEGNGGRVMMVELVGDRFLRRMVRVLVATAIREATRRLSPPSEASSGRGEGGRGGSESDGNELLRLCESGDRLATALAMPPVGLCLIEAGYPPYSPDSLTTH